MFNYQMDQLTEAEINSYGMQLERAPEGAVVGRRLSNRGVRAYVLSTIADSTASDILEALPDSNRAEETKFNLYFATEARSTYLASMLRLELAEIFGHHLINSYAVVGEDFTPHLVPREETEEEAEVDAWQLPAQL